jgi:2-dehydropantoate 2-reductase
VADRAGRLPVRHGSKRRTCSPRSRGFPAPLLRGAAIAPLLNGVDHVPLLRATFPQATVVPMTVSVEATRVAPGVIEHLSPFADYGISAGHRDNAVDPAALLRSAGLSVDASAPDEAATLAVGKLSFLAPFALLTTATLELSARHDRLGPICWTDWLRRPQPPRPRMASRSTLARGQAATSQPAGRIAIVHAQGRVGRGRA